MKQHFFKAPKRQISFAEYVQDTLITAKRIVEITPGKQRYTGAQFEMALIAFADLDALKKEMDEDIEVIFPKYFQPDWLAGFDWLDLAASYGDRDAIEYFKTNMSDDEFFSMMYQKYKKNCRPDCVLQHYEDKNPGLIQK